VAAFLYIAFYAVTDHIAGIGNGVVMQQSGASSTSERPEIGWLFDVANDVGGAACTWALAFAGVATAVVAARDGGRRALPGGVLLVISSGVLRDRRSRHLLAARSPHDAADGARLRLGHLNSAPGRVGSAADRRRARAAYQGVVAAHRERSGDLRQ
jgi:hypothetical protein